MTSETPVHYRIIPSQPAAHLFEVTCTVAEPDPAGQLFSLPAWIPGSYMIREFARNIVRIEAHAGGEVPGESTARAVSVEKLDKATWRCAPVRGPLTLRYEVYAWDLSVRAAHLDDTHAYFNGTSVFLRAHGQDDSPCTVDIQRPAGPAYTDWRVGTALPRAGAEPWGFGTYRAADYDELVDHPVEIADFAHVSFEAGGIPHDIVVYGRQNADLERLARDLKRICETHIQLFGELPPMERYVFLVMAVGEGYGGLEHRASCSLMCRRADLPQPGLGTITDEYRTFLGLCSHEYFHTWNVKRIKPEAFLPYDLSREAYTHQLWAFEGITSYYDDLGLARSGLIDAENYLELLGQTATRVWRGAGRFKQSVADSSFDAWTKFYRQDESAPNNIVSYYTKGSVIALALDMTIRRATGGERSLDDVVRTLWQRYGRAGQGVPEGGVERVAAEVAGSDLSQFFERYLYGTEDPPLADLLADVGIDFTVRAADNAADLGGKPGKATADEIARRGTLGVRSGADNGGARLLNVFDGGAAQAAGLSAGDLVIAVNGIRAAKDNLEKLISSYPPGTNVTVHVFRRDELMSVEVALQPPPLDTCVYTLKTNADESTTARRKAWLGLAAPAT